MDHHEGQATTPVDTDWLRNLALRAGAVLHDASHRHRSLRVDHKGRVDLVTETDLEIQNLLLTELRGAFPDDHMVAEEGDQGRDRSSGAAVWYIDPLDGTTNFVHGHPFCAISIGRWVDGIPDTGVVHAPLLDELFMARCGTGATLERPQLGVEPRPISGSPCTRLEDALLGTGFPYDRGATARLNLAICAHGLARSRGLRRAGSAALDLCHVALGRLDAYWEMGLQPWDLAAATVIAREAGVVVSDFRGDESVLYARRLAAARSVVHTDLLEMIQTAHREPDLEVLGPLPAGDLAWTGPLPGDHP
jgi:myo-inositol-1(or 4)-monophosphatase